MPPRQPKKEDKRKETSKSNMDIARLTRLNKLREQQKKKEEDYTSDDYVSESDSSSSSSESEEIVLRASKKGGSKKSKPKEEPAEKTPKLKPTKEQLELQLLRDTVKQMQSQLQKKPRSRSSKGVKKVILAQPIQPVQAVPTPVVQTPQPASNEQQEIKSKLNNKALSMLLNMGNLPY